MINKQYEKWKQQNFTPERMDFWPRISTSQWITESKKHVPIFSWLGIPFFPDISRHENVFISQMTNASNHTHSLIPVQAILTIYMWNVSASEKGTFNGTLNTYHTFRTFFLLTFNVEPKKKKEKKKSITSCCRTCIFSILVRPERMTHRLMKWNIFILYILHTGSLCQHNKSNNNDERFLSNIN